MFALTMGADPAALPVQFAVSTIRISRRGTRRIRTCMHERACRKMIFGRAPGTGQADGFTRDSSSARRKASTSVRSAFKSADPTSSPELSAASRPMKKLANVAVR